MSEPGSPSVPQQHETDDRRYGGGFVYFIRNALGLSVGLVSSLSLTAFVMGATTGGAVLWAPPLPEGMQMQADNRFVQMFIEQQVEEEAAVEPEPAEEIVDEVEEAVVEIPAAEPEPVAAPEPEPIVEEPPPTEEPPTVEDEQVAEAPAEEPAGDFGVEAMGGGGSGGGPGVNLPSGSNPNGNLGTGTRSNEEIVERAQERTEDRSARREERSRSEEDAARVMRLDEVGSPPEVVEQDPPIGYPRELREAAVAGLVVVECLITDDGDVRACRRRDGPDELAEYVISIVRNWQFSPARDHEGNAVVVNYTFRIPFRLT
jgi:protein TonB